jgi:hypothetical protein
VAALAHVTRWASTLVDTLRSAGVPEREIPTAVATSLALIHYESRGNPDAQHPGGAYGLTQQKKPWHPQHKGNPRAHLQHYATRYRANTKPGGPAAGSPPSFLMAWASGPGNLKEFIDTGEIPVKARSFMFRHIRNVQNMTSGSTWRDYSSWVHGWVNAGQPTKTVTISGRRIDAAQHSVPSAGALKSPWDGYLRWQGKSRKVGEAGPGGVTDLIAGFTSGQGDTMKVITVLLILAAGWLLWTGSR